MKLLKSGIALFILLISFNLYALDVVKPDPGYYPSTDIGRPVANGYFYVGIKDLDPEIPANQKQVTVRQESGAEVQIPQPVDLSAGGVPEYLGSPVTVLVDGVYSLKVFDFYDVQVYYIPESEASISGLIGEDHNSDGSHIVYESIADLRASTLTPFDGQVVKVTGYYAGTENRGWFFRWDAVSTTTDDNGIYIKDTSTTTGRWIRLREGPEIYVNWFGALLGGDPANNYTAFGLTADALVDGSKVIFSPGIYEIEYTGGYNPANIFGVTAFEIKDVKNIKIVGNKTTILIDDHDITANGGLKVFDYDGVQNLDISGFIFDLSFIGRNTSSTYYPQCGAITGVDTSGSEGSRTGDQLSSNIKVHDNVFDIYHPLGAYNESGDPFEGSDPNNGFKIFSFTALGDHTATSRENQNFDVSAYNNTFKDTHNAYGVWVWAYNDVSMYGNKANLWANISSDSSEVLNGGSIPLFRYHQFYCSGIDISHNRMTPRALVDRVGAYAGRAICAHIITNLGVDIDIPSESIFAYNTMRLRTNDTGITANAYGFIDISHNIFNGVDVTDRPIAAISLLFSENENGKAYVSIHDNNINRLFSAPSIRVDNGAALEVDRRLKVLSVKDNEFLNYYTGGILFINNTSKTTFGVELMYVEGNTFDGVASEFDPGNTNGAAIRALDCTEVTDLFYIRNNIIRHYYNIEKGGTYTAVIDGNDGESVTSSTNFNYWAASKQLRSLKTVAATETPRVGASNQNIFNYYAERLITATGVIQEVLSASNIAGGSAIAGATPAGEEWRIDQTQVGSKGL